MHTPCLVDCFCLVSRGLFFCVLRVWRSVQQGGLREFWEVAIWYLCYSGSSWNAFQPFKLRKSIGKWVETDLEMSPNTRDLVMAIILYVSCRCRSFSQNELPLESTTNSKKPEVDSSSRCRVMVD